jgi:hypothetical protein
MRAGHVERAAERLDAVAEPGQTRPLGGVSQATVRAEITETTLQAVPGILDPSQDGYDDTGTGQPAPMGDLTNTPRAIRVSQPAVAGPGAEAGDEG